jgi:WD40 repeat protein
LIYVKLDKLGNADLVSSDVNGGPITTLLPSSEFQQVDELLWLPDGRLLYELPERGPQNGSCNFWVVRFDLSTGERIEKPKRVTNWTGFCVSYTSVTADGKQLAFMQTATRVTVQLANLDPSGTRIVNSRHFTLSDNPDYGYDWTPDSRTFVFGSSRDGSHLIYKQALNEDMPEPVVSGKIDFRAARVSPDGKWIVGLVWPTQMAPDLKLLLMRVPITGGTPELIFPIVAHSWSMISCARPPSDLCGIANPTEDRRQLVVTAFDPVNGQGPELARFDLDPNEPRWYFAISPDGTRLAAKPGPEGPIWIHSLRDKTATVLTGKDLHNIESLAWAAGGQGLFVTKGMRAETEILYVDLLGNANVVWKSEGNGADHENRMQPSPDGRHLAIQNSTMESNMWRMENF